MTDPNDVDVISELSAAFEREPRIDIKHNPIRALLRDDRLTLEGSVANIAVKKLALRIAQRVCGAIPVLDHLRVASVDVRQEGLLRDQVVSLVMQEPVFNNYTIRVKRTVGVETLREGGTDFGGVIEIEVHAGGINLSGRVGSLTHRRLAEVLAWWSTGCEVVENRLRVVPPEKENDGELSDAVRLVLEKDPLVHAAQISVNVHQGEVELHGYVPSTQEKQLAVLDAWYVPGVRNVVDHIEARR